MSARNQIYRRCGHCEKTISEKTYKEHHRLFFHDGEWLKDSSSASVAATVQDDQFSRESSPLSIQRNSPCASPARSEPPCDIFPGSSVVSRDFEEKESDTGSGMCDCLIL